MIRFESVTKRYADGTVAVGNLTLEVPQHQITALVGPSGCGKTTTLRMINRLVEPSCGRIFVGNEDVRTMRPAQLRRSIGYVIQHGGLFPNKTVVDNIATVPRLLGEPRHTARSNALKLMERVGLSASLAGRYPAQLSGGQQQRVGVARALAADPPIMLMDEPFSAVDPVVRKQLQEEFLRLQADLGKTIVFVTHDIDEAIKLGDQVAVMRVGGTVAQLASPSDLLARPSDSFVADFVGSDRGYRGLGFSSARELTLTSEPTISLGDRADHASARMVDGWTLVVDDDGRPVGWLSAATAEQSPSGVITEQLLNLGGTLAAKTGTLRESLDAALSSPSGRGVIVDPAGRFAGTVHASHVLHHIEVSRAEGNADAPPIEKPFKGPRPAGGIASGRQVVSEIDDRYKALELQDEA